MPYAVPQAPDSADSRAHMNTQNARTPPTPALTKVGVVLATGAPANWDGGMVESPVVWFDTRNQMYAMVYTGYSRSVAEGKGYESVAHPQVGLAWSRDLVKWTKDKHNPIFCPDPRGAGLDSHGTAGPCVFVHEGRYHLFYFSTSEPGYEKGVKALHHATSTDLYTWRRDPGNPVVAPHGAGWRSLAIWHPHVVARDDWFWVFFNASGMISAPFDNAMAPANVPFEEETIGVARSRDLSRWEVLDDICPLLVGSCLPGIWDSTGRTGDPSLWRVGDTWYMAYYSWDGVNTRDGIAVTTNADFPAGWKPFAANPVLDIGQANEFDALHAGKPYIVRTTDRHFHFYTAVDLEESRNIALAYADLPYPQPTPRETG